MNKGEYGYLNRNKKMLALISLGILAVMAAVIIIAYICLKDIKNIFTVLGLLLSMPFARYLSGLIVLLPMKALPEEEKDEIETKLSHLGSDQFLWNLTLSSQEKVRHFPCVVYSDTRVMAWFDDRGKEKEDEGARRYFTGILKNGCYQAKVSVYCSKEEFLKAAKAEDFGVASEKDWEKVADTILIYQM